jgi:hypothetical protein
MKFIKATERLPAKPGCYHIKDNRYNTIASVSWYYCKGRSNSLLLRHPKDIEWLDENAPDERYAELEKQIIELLSVSGCKNIIEVIQLFKK